MTRPMRVALCAGASFFAIMSSGAAQAADAPSSTEVQEVVVTAQKREERLLDVPLPVQSISQEQLDKAGVSKVADLTSSIPGASLVSGTTPGFETIQIRGIASGTTGDGLVSYYVGDTPFGIPNLQLTPPARMLDLERVEIIRGPSATLYGQGAMGGTIKMVLAQPDSTAFSGKAQAEVSDTSGGGTNYNGDVVLNVPLVEGKLAARISYGYDSISGYAEAPELNLKDVNGFEGRNGRITLAWTPSDDLTVTAMYWNIRNRQDFSNSLTPHNALSGIPLYFPIPYGFPAIAGTGGRRGFTNVDADVFSLTANWRTPIGDLTANTSFIDHKLDFVTPLLSILVNDSLFATETYTNEIRLSSLPDSPVTWLIGASNRKADLTADIFYYSQFGLAGAKNSIINTLGVVSTDSYSLFGEASVELFGGKLTPLVGLAYFEDDRSSVGVDRATGLPRVAGGKWDSLNPRFNLKYKPADNGTIYFNAAKGFRSGTLQTPAQAAAADVSLGLPAGTIKTANEPDSLWTYELGTRWELANRRFLVEASIYRTDWSDVVVQFATAAVISLANAGDAEIKGADVGVVWRTPVEGLNLQGSAAYTDAQFTRVVGALSVGTAIKVGGPVPNVPERTFTVAMDYARDLNWLGGATGSLYVGYSYRDKTYDATTKGLASGELNDLTVRAGLKKDSWSLEAFSTNALDDDDPAVESSTALQILYPRKIGVRVGVNF
jgi:iron complex outermembrane receptor protein